MPHGSVSLELGTSHNNFGQGICKCPLLVTWEDEGEYMAGSASYISMTRLIAAGKWSTADGSMTATSY